MRKRICALALVSVFVAATAAASVYRIPEQSYEATAKAGANIASALSATASYYNPANMSWLQNAWHAEADFTYIHLSSVKYTDAGTSMFSGSSEEENFLLPAIFAVSPEYNNLHFGISATTPFGLAKRWDDPYPRTFAEKFTLKVYEVNPSASYKINTYLSVAGGVRLLYSTGEVVSNGYVADGITAGRSMEGDETAWGYNLALSVKPNTKSNISATYRSNVDLDLEGDATLFTNYGGTTINTKGTVEVNAPAVLSLSGSYLFFDKLTIDLTWDRTFWSEFEDFDFNYDDPISNPVLYSAFDAAIARNWKDSNGYRISFSYRMNDMLDLMAGFAYDETPIPEKTLGFELPDSDAYIFSAGARFNLSSRLSLGLGVLYHQLNPREVDNGIVDGEFKDGSALLITSGFSYTF
ncbi:MAG: aromatic hydrocarbon degradation membrane protein [Desulfobulbaceae bacterium BRH_c16a]|nr:MAG: aromatic hydrocarbon degradation membrane protein [Desulfobulbaceae bacterium BRH_c16a]